MTTAERISAAIANAHISYRELSKHTGIPTATLQRYATGDTTRIPVDKVEAIARATNVSSEYLLGWTDDINYVSNVSVSGTNNFVGNFGGDINVSCNEQEAELLRIFRALTPKQRHEFMSMAYEFDK